MIGMESSKKQLPKNESKKDYSPLTMYQDYSINKELFRSAVPKPDDGGIPDRAEVS